MDQEEVHLVRAISDQASGLKPRKASKCSGKSRSAKNQATATYSKDEDEGGGGDTTEKGLTASSSKGLGSPWRCILSFLLRDRSEGMGEEPKERSEVRNGVETTR